MLPLAVQTQMEAYAGRYFILKAPRRLVWRPHLGSVDLALTVGERRLEFTVTPLQAAILLPFQVGAPGRPMASCRARARRILALAMPALRPELGPTLRAGGLMSCLLALSACACFGAGEGGVEGAGAGGPRGRPAGHAATAHALLGQPGASTRSCLQLNQLHECMRIISMGRPGRERRQ